MRRNRLKDQRGQALIEYVLMLIVSISLLLLLIYQIFTPFQKFLQAYMGTYVQCLLEYGELPSFGGDDAGVGAASECNAKFEDFTVGDGRPPRNGSGNGGSSSGSKGSSDGSSSSSSSSSDSGSSSESDRSYAGSGGRGQRTIVRNFGSRGSLGAESGTEAAGKTIVVEIEAPGAGSGRFFSGGSSGGGSSQSRQGFVTGEQLSGFQQRDLERKKLRTNSELVVGENPQGNPPKKIPIKAPEREVSSADDEDKEFTIGNFIRILIIAAIIIAIIIFVGGQILQMSKSFSK